MGSYESMILCLTMCNTLWAARKSVRSRSDWALHSQYSRSRAALSDSSSTVRLRNTHGRVSAHSWSPVVYFCLSHAAKSRQTRHGTNRENLYLRRNWWQQHSLKIKTHLQAVRHCKYHLPQRCQGRTVPSITCTLVKLQGFAPGVFSCYCWTGGKPYTPWCFPL